MSEVFLQQAVISSSLQSNAPLSHPQRSFWYDMMSPSFSTCLKMIYRVLLISEVSNFLSIPYDQLPIQTHRTLYLSFSLSDIHIHIHIHNTPSYTQNSSDTSSNTPTQKNTTILPCLSPAIFLPCSTYLHTYQSAYLTIVHNIGRWCLRDD